MGESRKFGNFKVSGGVCAPFNLFKDDGELNLDIMEDYAKFLVEQKFTYLFINGTLAEGLSLTQSERKQTAEAWVKVAKDRFGIILHIGASNYKDSRELAKHAEEIGVNAIACFAPSYYKPESEEMVVEYLESVAAAAPNTPFYYYAINFMTGIHLNESKVLELAEKRIPTLVGIKHSSRELPSAHKCMMLKPRMDVLMGSDVQILTAFSLGMESSVIAPFLGKMFENLKAAFDKGDMETARKYQAELQVVNNIRGAFGGGINAAKAFFNIVSGLNAGPCRMPIRTLNADETAKLKAMIDASGLFK